MNNSYLKAHKPSLIIFLSSFAVFALIILISGIIDSNRFYAENGPVIHQNLEYITVATSTTETPTCYPVDNVATTTENGVYTIGYGLFVQQEYDKPYEGNPCPPTYPVITYVRDGVVESGVYAGYNRIIGFRTWDGPGGEIPAPYFFITKDYKTYKAVKHPLMPIGIEPDVSELQTLQRVVDKNKVTGLVDDTKDKINFPHAHTLTFGGFTYILESINVEKDSVSENIGTLASGESVYSDPVPADAQFGAYGYGVSGEVERDEQGKIFKKLKEYYTGTTKIFVVNKVGITAAYSLILKGKSELPNNRYERLGVLYGLDIVTKESVYKNYNQVTPTACGINSDTYVAKNIADTELRRIGATTYGINLYVFKDTQHPILKAQYSEKVQQFAYDQDLFSSLNGVAGETINVPTYEEYVAKNPVLLFKDNWGRLAIVGEFDYQIDGGCGKPVIYLYPETTTDVSVSFKNAVQLTTDIPAYNKGWYVQAEPNGTLNNIIPEVCDVYARTKHGSEYALEACQKNEYPYIYWAGNTYQKYPSTQEGFVVSADTLKKTLEEKLTYIGLNQKEVSDFVEYWYPEMIQKNTPYYRISFLQTGVMNRFIPMSVTPKPDTSIRVFLDWEPLSEFKTIAPQQLVKTVRQGFTLVEWGGLKR